MPPRRWHGGIVHAQPTSLPQMTGPFATATSRGGDANDGVRIVTTLDELESVTLARCYERGVLQGGKGEEQWAFESGVNEKVVLWRGDMTTLEVGAIVNAANRKLLGGGGIDGAIHRGAGVALAAECAKFPIKVVRGPPSRPYDVRIEAGECVVTDAFALPAQKIFHIVGPDTVRPLRMGNLAATPQEQEQQLRSCYETCLQKAVEDGLGSLALCAISVGAFGYDLQAATHVALATVRTFLSTEMEKIIFVVFTDAEVTCYAKTLPQYFPPPE